MGTEQSLTVTKIKYAVAGLVVGASIATYFTHAHFDSSSKVQLAQQAQLQSDSEALQQQKQQLQTQLAESQQQATQASSDLTVQLEETQAKLAKSEAQVKTLKQQAASDSQKLKETHAQELEVKQQQLVALQEKSDKQNEVLEQSKTFFQKQLTLQQELTKLNEERAKIIPLLNKAVDECQIFLEGKSWDAKSDACDRKEKASTKLKQIDDQIDAKQSKIVAIDSTSEAIGLQKRID